MCVKTIVELVWMIIGGNENGNKKLKWRWIMVEMKMEIEVEMEMDDNGGNEDGNRHG